MVPDGPFHPTLLNTAIFLLTAVMQLNTFTANYRGTDKRQWHTVQDTPTWYSKGRMSC